MKTTERVAATRRWTGQVLAMVIGFLAVVVVFMSASIRAEDHDAASMADIPIFGAGRDLDRAMAKIDLAARNGLEPSPGLIADVVEMDGALPLRPEPFLVAALDAQGAGNAARAERLLIAARERDPRSAPVRYFLAEHFRRQGDMDRALHEIGALIRLRSDAAIALAPYFAGLAEEAGGRKSMASFLKANPVLGRQVLAVMANAATDPQVVLDLGRQLPPGPADSVWQGNLVNALIAKGDVAAARQAWLGLTGLATNAPLLFNPAFDGNTAPPPFNWRYASNADGVAEADGKGGLSLLYYDRAALVLAQQWLALPPGAYRLSWKATATPADSGKIIWRATCISNGRMLAEQPVSSPSMAMSVTADCPFVQLDLVGRPSTSARDASASISHLALGVTP